MIIKKVIGYIFYYSFSNFILLEKINNKLDLPSFYYTGNNPKKELKKYIRNSTGMNILPINHSKKYNEIEEQYICNANILPPLNYEFLYKIKELPKLEEKKSKVLEKFIEQTSKIDIIN